MTGREIFCATPGASVERCQASDATAPRTPLACVRGRQVIGVLSIRDVLEEIIAEEEQVIRELETDRLVMTTDTGAY